MSFVSDRKVTKSHCPARKGVNSRGMTRKLFTDGVRTITSRIVAGVLRAMAFSGGVRFERFEGVFSDPAIRASPVAGEIFESDALVFFRIVNVSADRAFVFFHAGSLS